MLSCATHLKLVLIANAQQSEYKAEAQGPRHKKAQEEIPVPCSNSTVFSNFREACGPKPLDE
jgi:hypothetical protein